MDAQGLLSAWTPERPSGSGSWKFPVLKLKTGKTQVRVLDESPVHVREHFKSIEKQVVVCPGAGCYFCQRGDEISTRHYINVFSRATNQVKVLVISDAAMYGVREFIERLVEAGETEIDLRKHDLVFTREGTTKENTRYFVSRIEGVPLPTDKEVKRFSIEEHLKPMSLEEMAKYQNSRPNTDERGQGFSRPAKSSLVSQDVKSILDDDGLPI